MDVHFRESDVAESVAGVVRLLRRAGALAWLQADLEGYRSPRQLLALGIDLAADEAQALLPDGFSVHGPQPVGGQPAGLLQSAQLLLHHLCLSGAPLGVHAVHNQVADLVWEANTGAGA